MAQRKAIITRDTKETNITVKLSIDGRGKSNATTGLRMLDHMLDQLARHGTFDIDVSATGTDAHHVVEDIAICLGRAFGQALGQRQAIVRMAHAVVPMDDALAMVAVDLGGRSHASIETSFSTDMISDLPADLISHFLETFASEAKLNIHAKVLRGINDHHKIEALFKALARALDTATMIDERIKGSIPSTKGLID